MMRCIIIEDQPPAQRILKKFIGDVSYLELEAVFSDPLQAMEFLKKEPVDLIFLDIHLPKLSGIDFLKILPDPPHVILTTAFPDYALESYEFSVVDYLLKPFSFQRFVKAVSKVPDNKTEAVSQEEPVSAPSPDMLFVKSGYDHVKINISDILFIKSEADYTEIFTEKKKYLTSHPLKYWLEKLSAFTFRQIHKSYIVNTVKIVKVSGNQIYFESDHVVPIGRAFKEGFVKEYLKS